MTETDAVMWWKGALSVVKVVSLVWAVIHFGWLVLVPLVIANIEIDGGR